MFTAWVLGKAREHFQFSFEKIMRKRWRDFLAGALPCLQTPCNQQEVHQFRKRELDVSRVDLAAHIPMHDMHTSKTFTNKYQPKCGCTAQENLRTNLEALLRNGEYETPKQPVIAQLPLRIESINQRQASTKSVKIRASQNKHPAT